jgi:hypothetical protein
MKPSIKWLLAGEVLALAGVGALVRASDRDDGESDYKA